jgi:hypothetical protein
MGKIDGSGSFVGTTDVRFLEVQTDFSGKSAVLCQSTDRPKLERNPAEAKKKSLLSAICAVSGFHR